MFRSISWHQFLITVTLPGLLYYVFVITMFYRKDIAGFVKKKLLRPGEVQKGRVREE